MNKKRYFVYIMTNMNKSTLYIGISGNLSRRIYEHKSGIDQKAFSKKYNLNKLVYYEMFENPKQAIDREKQLKKWKRKWKEDLINKTNKYWKDLSEEMQCPLMKMPGRSPSKYMGYQIKWRWGYKAK